MYQYYVFDKVSDFDSTRMSSKVVFIVVVAVVAVLFVAAGIALGVIFSKGN